MPLRYDYTAAERIRDYRRQQEQSIYTELDAQDADIDREKAVANPILQEITETARAEFLLPHAARLIKQFERSWGKPTREEASQIAGDTTPDALREAWDNLYPA